MKTLNESKVTRIKVGDFKHVPFLYKDNYIAFGILKVYAIQVNSEGKTEYVCGSPDETYFVSGNEIKKFVIDESIFVDYQTKRTKQCKVLVISKLEFVPYPKGNKIVGQHIKFWNLPKGYKLQAA